LYPAKQRGDNCPSFRSFFLCEVADAKSRIISSSRP
jgi:hypothetical protein